MLMSHPGPTGTGLCSAASFPQALEIYLTAQASSAKVLEPEYWHLTYNLFQKVSDSFEAIYSTHFASLFFFFPSPTKCVLYLTEKAHF